MKATLVAWGLVVSMIAGVPAAIAQTGDGDACPPLPLNPWNDLDRVSPDCADTWRAQLEENAADWAALVVDEDCHEFPPRGVSILPLVPHPDCAASWAAWTAAFGTFLAATGVEFADAIAAYVVGNSGDSDGDGLPQFVEHQVCGRGGVEALVTGTAGVGTCHGINDYETPA